jgi:AAHS family 4-hydroxybenzoate transporter-like MFS transporter
VLSIFLFFFLHESLDFLVRNKAEGHRIWHILRRVDPALPEAAPRSFTTEEKEVGSAVGSLFTSGRALGTIVLWIIFFLNLAEFYALQSWLPTILTNLHYPLTSVALATTLTTVGGIVIAIVIGPAMDRLGPYLSLSVLYLLGVFFVSLMGVALSYPEWVLMVATFFAGCCVSGGQKSVIALSAVFYPAPIRSTGVGWALGIGRIGGIGGPLLIGLLLGWHLSPASLFYAASIPMLIASLLVALLGWRYGTRALTPKPALATSR